MEAANSEIQALNQGARALLDTVSDAYTAARDPQLEADAEFEVPISIEFAATIEEIRVIRGDMTTEIVRFADIIDLSAINAATDKYNELSNAGNGGNGGGNGGGVDTDTDEESGEEGGATSLTTFATIAIASVYTLAF